jgi:hypothetical protein
LLSPSVVTLYIIPSASYALVLMFTSIDVVAVIRVTTVTVLIRKSIAVLLPIIIGLLIPVVPATVIVCHKMYFNE